MAISQGILAEAERGKKQTSEEETAVKKKKKKDTSQKTVEGASPTDALILDFLTLEP